MITDGIVDAMDNLIELCSDENQKNGMEAMREMLCDWSEEIWDPSSTEERREWLIPYLNCKPANKMRSLRVGDKVKVNLDVVSQNGLFESDEQQKQFDYLESHPEDVFTIGSTTVDALAQYKLDHPVVGETSFYAEELILEDGIDED